MSDLTDRLRAAENFYAESSMWRDRDLADAVVDAADEIDRLRSEVFRLQEEVKYLENRLEDEMYGDKEPKY